MTKSRETVFVVDDDPGVREAVGFLLRSIGLHAQLFASARELLAITPPADPACALLDVRMPGISGLDCQRQMSAAGFRIPVLFMTGHGDIPMSVRAMKAGAREFLTKPFREQELIEAVQRALDHDRERCSREHVLMEMRERFASLTRREREVMTGVVSGRLNKQIAEDLGTSEITVKVHRSHMMRKMAAESVPDLVRMAERLELPLHT
jgi:FixJ family two-component response regulator